MNHPNSLVIDPHKACKIIKENLDLMEQIMRLIRVILNDPPSETKLPNITLDIGALIKLGGAGQYSYQHDFYGKGSHGNEIHVNLIMIY